MLFFTQLLVSFLLLFFALPISAESSGFHEGVYHSFDSCLDDALLAFHVQHIECFRNVIELRAVVQECIEVLFLTALTTAYLPSALCPKWSLAW